MSIEGVHNNLFEANRDLNAAISYSNNGYSETGIRLCMDKAYQPLRESLSPIDVHVTESAEALELAEAALHAIRDIRSLDSLPLPAMRSVKDRAADAEQKFAAATKLVEMIVETTGSVPELLEPIPTVLSRYSEDGNAILEFSQRRDECIKEAKVHIDTALEGQTAHPLSQKSTELVEKASSMSQMTVKATECIVGENEEGTADSSLLHTFIGNMCASLTLLESALDKPLDQFVALLADATNKVTTTDLEYLKDLGDRLRQGIDTHAAASNVQEEIRRSIFDIQDGIKAAQRTL